jgi:hypothetical protein
MLFRNKFYAILLAYMPYGRAYVNSIDIYSLRHKNAVIIRAVQTHTFIFHLLVPRYLGQPKKKNSTRVNTHRGGPCSCPDQSTWYLWCMKWHLGWFSSESFGPPPPPLNIFRSLLHVQSCIIWGMNKGPVSSLEIQFHAEAVLSHYTGNEIKSPKSSLQ